MRNGVRPTLPRGRAGAFAQRLVIMVKEPVAGRVKTRLARDIGTVRATAFFRENMRSTTARLDRDQRWQTILAVAPEAATKSRMLIGGGARMPPLMPQGGGDLGARLTRIARHAPAGPLVIIGADIPGIHAADIASAFAALRAGDAVFGPSSDGGYWLIGLKARARRAKGAFANVRWSTAFAFSDTRANVSQLKVSEITVKDDVDDGDDFERLSPLIGRRVR